MSKQRHPSGWWIFSCGEQQHSLFFLDGGPGIHALCDVCRFPTCGHTRLLYIHEGRYCCGFCHLRGFPLTWWTYDELIAQVGARFVPDPDIHQEAGRCSAPAGSP